jgi:secretion/DNA translocation related TadE-like protein
VSSDRGSIAVVVLGAVAEGLVLVIAIVATAQLTSGRARAVNAADAAALAAAPVTFRAFGAQGSPAEEAERFAAANGATLVTCECRRDGTYASRVVVVTVRVTVDVLGFRQVSIEADSAAEFRPVQLLIGP